MFIHQMLPHEQKQSQKYRKIAIAKMRGANFISEGKIEILKKSVDCVFLNVCF